MTLTSKDVQDQVFHDAWRGYNQQEVDEFLDRVAEALDALSLEARALRERVRDLEDQVVSSHHTEEMLKQTLVTAQKAAEEAIATAKAKADELIAQAERRTKTSNEEARLRLEAAEREQEERLAKLDRETRTHLAEAEKTTMERLAADERATMERLAADERATTERLAALESKTMERLAAHEREQMARYNEMFRDQQERFDEIERQRNAEKEVLDRGIARLKDFESQLKMRVRSFVDQQVKALNLLSEEDPPPIAGFKESPTAQIPARAPRPGPATRPQVVPTADAPKERPSAAPPGRPAAQTPAESTPTRPAAKAPTEAKPVEPVGATVQPSEGGGRPAVATPAAAPKPAPAATAAPLKVAESSRPSVSAEPRSAAPSRHSAPAAAQPKEKDKEPPRIPSIYATLTRSDEDDEDGGSDEPSKPTPVRPDVEGRGPGGTSSAVRESGAADADERQGAQRWKRTRKGLFGRTES